MQGTYTAPRIERRALAIGAPLLPLLIFIAALVPRVLQLGVFATMDEVNFWFMRSEVFLNALRNGNFAATAVTDHPGVTTMWLGALGLLLRDVWMGQGWIRVLTPQDLVAFFEIGPAVVNALGVGIGYVLLKPMVSRSLALVGALLWAFDPFVVAYSRVLHVDMLAGTFLTLSVLAAARYWFYAPQRSMLILSGVFGALAALSKSPGLIIGPVVVGIAAYAFILQRGTPEQRPPIKSLLIWGVAMVVTALLVWPALWADPYGAYEQIRIGYTAEGTQPHQLGNYYLGKAYYETAPDITFYMVAVSLRLTPITLPAILLLPLAWGRIPQSAPSRRTYVALMWFAILFIFAMSLFAKKFNRYVVPAFPALDLIAAFGLVWFFGTALPALVRQWFGSAGRIATQWIGYSVLVIATAVNVAWWQPYYISAFNQLLGGAPMGEYAFKTGWGEGMEQVAAWLNEQSDITDVLTITTLKTGLQLYMREGAQARTPLPGPLLPKSGYIVVYVESAQTNDLPEPFSDFYGKVAPIKVIQEHGVDYAWIYKAPPDMDHKISATFDKAGTIYGLRQPQDPQTGTTIHYTLGWQPGNTPAPTTMLFAHLIGPDNQRHAQIDLPFPPQPWDFSVYNLMDLPLTIPADAPAGDYKLLIGLYDSTTGARLPLQSAARADEALDGPEVVLVDTITLRKP